MAAPSAKVKAPEASPQSQKTAAPTAPPPPATTTTARRQLPSPPPLDFRVQRRAVLSSDDDDYEETAAEDQKEQTPNGARKTIKLSEEEEENGMEMDDAGGAEGETNWLNGQKTTKKKREEDGGKTAAAKQRKKKRRRTEEDAQAEGMLKALKRKAEKLRQKKKLKTGKSGGGRADSDDDDAEDDSGGDDGDLRGGADSFDSDDSDAGERMTAKQLKLQRELEQKCVDFVNNADEPTLKECDKFNDRFIAFVLQNRPFANFKELRAKASDASGPAARGAGRGKGAGGNHLRTLDAHLEWLESRGVLDQVLDDCRASSKALEKAVEEARSKPPIDRPPGLNPECTLHPYQQVGLNWLILMSKLGLNAILADEMGLGKTIQVIAFLAWAKHRQEMEPRLRGPHLIVVPSSTIENWMQEIAHWAPSLRVLTYYGSIEERQQLRHSARRHAVDMVLTTYNMVISRTEDRKFFKKFSLNYVIYDEGHMLRNCATQRYTNLMKVRGKRKILLTGTPLQNNLVELISLLYFTMRQLFDKYCENIGSLLQLFAVKGNVLMEGGGGSSQSMPAAKGGRKKAKDEDGEGEEVMNGGGAEGDAEAEEAKGRSLYEKHKIAQAKSILQPFVLRRLKIEVLSCLSTKHEHIELCEPTRKQLELYAQLIDTLRARRELRVAEGAAKGGGGGGTGGMDLLMQMRQVANHPLLYRTHYGDDKVMEMAKALCMREKFYEKKRPEYVAEDLAYETDIALHLLCQKFGHTIGHFALDERLALESGKCRQLDILLPAIVKEKAEKVLIFSQFTSLLDILELYMRCRNYKFLRMDGSTPVLERQELINKFNNSATISVFLLSTKAGGLGINLTAANHIIIHDIDFNPYNDKQAEDRCHRMGQTKDVHVVRLISKGTIEEQMLALAFQKLELERDVTTSAAASGRSEKNDSLAKKTMEQLLNEALRGGNN